MYSVKTALRTVTGGSSSEAADVVADLRALNAAVTGMQLERASERSMLLLADARARFALSQQPTAATAAAQSKARPRSVNIE